VKSSALALGKHARLGILICYLLALALWTMAIRAVRLEWYAPLALLPMALHLLGQVATLKLDDGADALARFRSNRFAGLLMFAACYVVGTA
jgi:4-hydroxybenzoate polyprenyltransferase